MSARSLQSEFVLQNSRLWTKLSKRVDGAFSVHGISFTEFMVMHYLAESALKTMRRIELAENVGISASGVTRMLAPMEKIGLVEKEINPRDARQSLVKLSKAGARLYADAVVSFEHCSKDLLQGVSDKQLAKLLELMHKLS
jgi:DNA-binding MarR family transcriptional regulator